MLIALAGSSLAAVAPAAARVSASIPGIVDINTNISYQGESGAGTGMVLTSNGEILTNNHVIRGATTIRVVDIATGHSYTATVVGYSLTSDVAILQLKNASGLKTVPLGDSSTVKVGAAVTAIGNAGGVGGQPSQVTGSVTKLHQAITATEDNGASEQLTGLLETNAQLQPGDSGGPLVDSAGQVIGMDTAASTSFAFAQQATHAYAIPIDVAATLARQIEAGQSSEHVHVGPTPFLGVDVQVPNSYYGQPASYGLVVDQTIPGSPVAKAGLVAGDLLTTLDGEKITTPNLLTTLLLTKAPGATVTLGWIDTNNVTQHTSVTLAAGPPQ